MHSGSLHRAFLCVTALLWICLSAGCGGGSSASTASGTSTTTTTTSGANTTTASNIPGVLGDGVWLRSAVYAEEVTFDPCNAHQPPSGEYHYHADPVCLRYQLGD